MKFTKLESFSCRESFKNVLVVGIVTRRAGLGPRRIFYKMYKYSVD